MKKRIVFIFFVILIILMSLFIYNHSNRGRRPEAMIDLDKLRFAYHTRAFDFQMVIDGEIKIVLLTAWERAHPSSPWFDPFYTELVFVHSQEEAQGFPDSTIVAWPRDEWSQSVIRGIHWAASRSESDLISPGGLIIREPFSLADFGLTYTLSVADLVDNWEKINDLWWNGLDQSERSFIPYSTWSSVGDE